MNPLGKHSYVYFHLKGLFEVEYLKRVIYCVNNQICS